MYEGAFTRMRDAASVPQGEFLPSPFVNSFWRYMEGGINDEKQNRRFIDMYTHFERKHRAREWELSDKERALQTARGKEDSRRHVQMMSHEKELRKERAANYIKTKRENAFKRRSKEHDDYMDTMVAHDEEMAKKGVYIFCKERGLHSR